MIRRGLGRGKGMGYKNLVPQDRPVHRDSGRGIKQPQIKSVPMMMMKPTMRKNNTCGSMYLRMLEHRNIAGIFNGNPYPNWRTQMLGYPTTKTYNQLTDEERAKVIDYFEKEYHEKVLNKDFRQKIIDEENTKQNRECKFFNIDEPFIKEKISGGLGEKKKELYDEDEPREMTEKDAVRMFDTERDYRNAVGRASEKIIGGLGDNRPDSDFDSKELKKGIKVEMEHTKDPKVAKEIVRDHLTEFPKGYYEGLDKLEKKLKLENETINSPTEIPKNLYVKDGSGFGGKLVPVGKIKIRDDFSSKKPLLRDAVGRIILFDSDGKAVKHVPTDYELFYEGDTK